MSWQDKGKSKPSGIRRAADGAYISLRCCQNVNLSEMGGPRGDGFGLISDTPAKAVPDKDPS